MKNVVRLALFTLLLLAIGCSMQSPIAVSSPSVPTGVISQSSVPASVPIAVESESNDASLRMACATRVLEELIRAFNTGDAVALERTLGSGLLAAQGFRWVSFYDGLGGDTQYTAEGARKMLLDRWSQGQRLTLVSVAATNGPSWHGGVDASVRLEGRAPSLTGVAPILGKTALSCVGARVYVLSVAGQ